MFQEVNMCKHTNRILAYDTFQAYFKLQSCRIRLDHTVVMISMKMAHSHAQYDTGIYGTYKTTRIFIISPAHYQSMMLRDLSICFWCQNGSQIN